MVFPRFALPALGLVSISIAAGSAIAAGHAWTARAQTPVVYHPLHSAPSSMPYAGGGTQIADEDRNGATQEFDENEFADRMQEVRDRQEEEGIFVEEEDERVSGIDLPAFSSTRTDGRAYVLPPYTAGCVQSLSLLGIADGAVTCGDRGMDLPDFYGGDCPVVACVLKWDDTVNWDEW